MALKMGKLFGEKSGSGHDTDMGVPTTQVRMGSAGAASYDPLASVSIMDQLRTASAASATPSKLPIVGGLPVVKQFQVLGVLFVVLAALALFMLWLDGRTAAQKTASLANATDMQMLSQRLSWSSVLAVQGQPGALKAVKESRDHFRDALDAFINGGTVRGTTLDVGQDPLVADALTAIKSRWERVSTSLDRVLGSEATLSALEKGRASVAKASDGLPELAQQAGQQLLQAGGSARDVSEAGQLGTISVRIVRDLAQLTGNEDADADMAGAVTRQVGAFRDTLAGLSRTAEGLRATGTRGDEARASLAELGKRLQSLDSGVAAVVAAMPQLTVAKRAARNVASEGEPLFAETTKLAAEFEGTGKARIVSQRCW